MSIKRFNGQWTLHLQGVPMICYPSFEEAWRALWNLTTPAGTPLPQLDGA